MTYVYASFGDRIVSGALYVLLFLVILTIGLWILRGDCVYPQEATMFVLASTVTAGLMGFMNGNVDGSDDG